MKIYLLVANDVTKQWHDAIRGVFSTIEFAQAAYPGEWKERMATDAGRLWITMSGVWIFEYEVDQKVEAIKS